METTANGSFERKRNYNISKSGKFKDKNHKKRLAISEDLWNGPVQHSKVTF
jgi:hypothetical protein